jgi:hypothetical protein
MTSAGLDSVAKQVIERAPLTLRELPQAEQEWRARYFLMVVGAGASALFAWANALAPDPNGECEALAASVPDMAIANALDDRRIRIEDCVPY